jgi:uncharacterized membrane protein YdjX (TVP38/TMEM64 family)
MQTATYRQLGGICGLLGVAAVAAMLFSPSAVIDGLENLAERPALFLVAIGAVYVIRPFLLWPVTSIAVGLGYLYGPVVALPIALLGAGVTGVPPYLVGRYAGTDAGLFGYIRGSGQQLIDVAGETRGVIAARLSPIPGDAVSYGSGLSEVSLGPFFFGTVVGEIPWAAVAVLAGASMRSLTVSEFAYSPLFLLGLTALAALVLIGPLYSRAFSGAVADS